jgi:hypothetical protein
MQTATDSLTLQFLGWVSERPRTYGDAMDRWRTSCPRLSIWEDAILERLVQIDNRPGGARNEAAVSLTPRGRALLDAQ